ncbi:Sma2p TDEL_0D00890 [Torulaspora delbrueckii]|uniref:Spore membrane assembly protein 2 n=1 Tax=Torulaspora delbrueckii TaxID=4950 RepID=G8ZSS9_TORDE|nr:hypothetical protein TDEL_0D00890 [Torulaspora delbrueckii]CCE91673.1 hypothetical protein TDEL_0D00890 [Torulaspora delbrueckii]
MLIFKRLIVWIILFVIALTQLLLYIPNFSCRGSSACLDQFNFSIIGSSSVTQDFINSIKEFLKLLSYLAIDMGWSRDLTDSDIYREEKLVDTFDSENVYKVNYFGYCKKRHGERLYCVQNWGSGMDVLGILVRDIGIQLGMLSASHQNDTRLLGDSMVLTYHLALSSLRRFLRGDQGNALSKLVISKDDYASSKSDAKTSRYSKGVDMAYLLKVANKFLLLIELCELSTSLLFLTAVICFGIALSMGIKLRIIPLVLKIMISALASLATITFTGTIIYFLALRSLQPSKDPLQSSTKWDIIKINLGPGFIIGCIRYAIQIILIPLAFLIARHYSAREKETKEAKIEPPGFQNDWL